MRIKRINRYFIHTVGLLLGCMLTFAACVNEEEDALSPEEQGKEIVGLSMNIANRSGVAGSDSEIKKVRIIAFDSRSGELIYNQKIDNPADNPVRIEMLSGVRDFYVITNEPASQTSVLNNVQILKDLQAVQIPWNEVEQEATFVTFGTLPTQSIKSKELNEITVKNHRLAVKIDLTLNGKNFTPAQEVSFKNLPDAIPLFDVPYDCSVDNRKTKTVKSLTVPGTVTPGYVWTRETTIVLPSYIFSPITDTDKAVKISVPIGSGEVGEAIGHSVSGNDYTLHRNTIYSLTANVGPESLVIDAQVRNWDDKKTDYPAGGGSFWKGQPEDTRVGLNGTDADATATFTATLNANGTNLIFKWYRVKQKSNTDFTLVTEEVTTGVVSNDQTSSLTLKADGLDDACMVYCIASITALDGQIDRLESNHATFMPVGDWIQPEKYPYMQNWKAPLNAPLGSTCLLQDERDKKVYRVKLMADGNWWMIQDLAYGNASTSAEFRMYHFDHTTPFKSEAIYPKIELYGIATTNNPSTGGILYNSHAALQLEGLPADLVNDGADCIKYTFLQSLCPDGWHLPGNMDDTFNKEWQNLKDIVGSQLSLCDMRYNSPVDFNAYTHAVVSSKKAYLFHGGYRAGAFYAGGEDAWLTFYTREEEDGQFIVPTQVSGRLNNNIGAPIRCLRNFK